MDGFAGYKTAAAEVIPDAVTVMDPFHVVALAGTKLDLFRQASSSRPSAGAVTPAIRSTGFAASPAPVCSCSPARQYARLTGVARRRRAPRRQGRLADLPEDHRRLRRCEPAPREDKR